METRVNYTIVGLFVVLLTLAIAIIALWLTQSLQEKPYKTYLVYMNESVAGLSKQAPVKYNGVDVGYVQNLKINLDNPQQVILNLQIEPYVPITEDTKAVLTVQGLTGIAYIGLQGGRPGSKKLLAEGDQDYPIIKSAPSFMMRLDQSLDNLTHNINQLTNNVRLLLNQSNLNAVAHTLKNIDEVTTTIAQDHQEIDSGIKSLQVALKQLPNLTQHLDKMADNMNQTSRGLNEALQMLNIQLFPEAFLALQSFRKLSQDISHFSQALNQNPNMLIQGHSYKKLGPGEK